jgi:stage III sporulation protein AG
MNIFDKFKNIIAGDKNNKDSRLLKNLLYLGLLGMILIFAGNLFNAKENSETETELSVPSSENIEENSYETKLGKDLEEIVSSIKGVGKSKVQIMFKEGIEFEYEYDIDNNNKITNENDQNGGERRIEEDKIQRDLVIIKDSSGNEKAVIKKERLPDVTGILIVAEGSENSEIKYKIYKSISELLDLPLYKINVLPFERGD